MKLRNILASIAAAAVLGTGGIALTSSHGQAQAAGSTIETISETKTMVTVNCYETVTKATTYYTHSVTKGWVREASPKIVLTHKETCDK